MKKEFKKATRIRDPHQRYRAALEKLEQFAAQAVPDGSISAKHRAEESKGLTAVFSLAAGWIAAAFSDRKRDDAQKSREQTPEDVLRAIDELKRYHPLIKNKRSEEAKTLAMRAIQTINTINRAIDCENEHPPSWRDRLLKRLIKKNTLFRALTKKITISESSSDHALPERLPHFLEHSDGAPPPSEREKDVFKMKAISLINHHGFLFPTIQDALNTIHQSPIYSTVAKDETKGGIAASALLRLEQKLSPFPGETVILRGEFKRDQLFTSSPTPIPKSFAICTAKRHSGFPDPAQYAGWSLADPLVASAIHHADEIPPLLQLLESKRVLAVDFRNRGPCFRRAIDLLNQKRELVKDNRKSFLSLHEKLFNELTGLAASFDWALESSCAFNAVCSFYRDAVEEAVLIPHQRLEHAWLHQTDPDLLSSDPNLSYQTATKLLQAELDRMPLRLANKPQPQELLLALAEKLGQAAAKILLQSFSEAIECPPPKLLPFDRKIQSLAYRQLEQFIKEAEGKYALEGFVALEKLIQSDIAELQGRNETHPLVGELDAYFIRRFEKSTP